MPTKIVANIETGESEEVEIEGDELTALEALLQQAAAGAIVYASRLDINRRLRTTNATPAELYRATLAPLTGYRADLRLLAVDAGSGALRSIHASIVAKRLGNGALLVGSPVVIANHQDAAASAWGITAAAEGNDFVITVAGAASRNIDWLLTGDVVSFTPGGR